MLKKVLSGRLTLLRSSSRLHVPAQFVTGQHQEPDSDLERHAQAQILVARPVTIAGSAAAPGIPIEGLGGVFKRP
jgi:hypothetical protein